MPREGLALLVKLYHGRLYNLATGQVKTVKGFVLHVCMAGGEGVNVGHGLAPYRMMRRDGRRLLAGRTMRSCAADLASAHAFSNGVFVLRIM